ncbi:MAG: arylesterase [Pseudomonas sp.]|nr:arylesterase [Pseudomonas sp.]
MRTGKHGAVPVVTLLGDSISAGYGLTPNDSLPAQLRSVMANLGIPVRVVGAGVDGNTTADGLARLGTSVPGETDLCIVALGANDLMQTLPPPLILENLNAIVANLVSHQIGVLLCGMKAPPWLSTYAPAFDAVFPAIAERHRVPLYPFLLEGVALDPRFNQADRIHPNAAGIAVIARRLAPAVVAALAIRSGAAS